METPPGKSTAAAIPALSLKIDSDSRPVPHATLRLFSPIPAPALLLLQELFTPDFGVQRGKLHYCSVGGRESVRTVGRGLAKVTNAVLAFAFPSSRTLVAFRVDPLHLQGNTRRPPKK